MDMADFYHAVRLGVLDASYPTEQIDEGLKVALLELRKLYETHCPDRLRRRALLPKVGAGVFGAPVDSRRILAAYDLRSAAIPIESVTILEGEAWLRAANHGLGEGALVTTSGLSVTGAPDGNRYTATLYGPDPGNLFGLLELTAPQAGYIAGGHVYDDSKMVEIHPIYPRQEEALKGYSRQNYIWMGNALRLTNPANLEGDVAADFVRKLSALADVDEDHHFGLVAFCVMQMGQPPDPETHARLVEPYRKNQAFYASAWETLIQNLESLGRPHMDTFTHTPVRDF
jgi:hypothetical protein